MAALSATTAPTLISGWLLVQNLGPQVVYADSSAAGTSSTGLKIEVNGVLELRGMSVWVYTGTATADVRYL